ncbi:MAG: M50 family metallopeptidase [Gemmatimonadetes bacterium]|nr:M50 family metallopeptidase [Gemmatimonadota bacterium]
MKPVTRRRTRLVLGLAAFYVALWFLWFTPVIFPLKIFVVLLHEVSHALAALATGGAVERIVLNVNQGGATYVLGGNAFLILSAGYLGSLLWGLLLIELAGMRAKRARWAVGLLGGFVLLVAILLVRNMFGLLFTAAFGVALIVSARYLPPRGVANVLLVLGLTSALYAVLDIRSDIISRPHLRSDAGMLSEMTGIPTAVWGFLWIGLALAACWIALRRWWARV